MSQIKARPAPFTVTDSAVQRVRAILEQEDRSDLRLRISVAGGGCSGFQYGFELDDKDEPGDVVVTRDGVSVVIDDMSLLYVIGAEVDFVEDLTGSYFRLSNPNAASSCGCGNSFSI